MTVIAVPDAILIHAVEHDFAGASFLYIAYPFHRFPIGSGCSLRVTRKLIYLPAVFFFPAVDSDDDTLGAEPRCQIRNKVGIGEGRRIYRDLVGTPVQDVLGIGHGPDAAGDAKRYVEHCGDLTDPGTVDGATVRTGRNIVEHEFVGTLPAVPVGQIDDFTDDPVIAKLDALDDFAVANVEAGNYATCRYGPSSSVLILPSSNALPVIAAYAPSSSSARRSSACLTPPDACNLIVG